MMSYVWGPPIWCELLTQLLTKISYMDWLLILLLIQCEFFPTVQSSGAERHEHSEHSRPNYLTD